MKKAGLVGKYYLHSGPEYYQFGVVLENLPDGLLLLKQISLEEGHRPQTVASLGDIIEGYEQDGSPLCEWQFFDTERELRAFIDWINSPVDDKKPKVVKLHSVKKPQDPKPL